MGCSARFDYCTPNVPWDTYFNGDQALHGTYWHNMFGKADMSHGCVNLSVANAKTVYDFAPIGTPVSVHY
jgi:lipoprotein-anchoring transpeptidase ErfK/SrfK